MNLWWYQAIKSFKKIIILPLFLLLSSPAFSAVTCPTLWGKAKAKNNSSCEINNLSDGLPSLIQISKNINRKLNTESLFIDLKAQHIEALNGLQVRFLKDGNIMYQYDLPIFKDTHFNFLQENLTSTLSIPFSQLTKVTAKTSSYQIDEVQLYIDVKKSQSFGLTIHSLLWKKKKAADGIISISFDDGYLSQFKAAKIMKKIDIPGIAYLIPDALNKANYLSNEQISQLSKWNWDISSHHQTPITDFKKQDLNSEFKAITESIKKISRDDQYKHFAYPLGRYDKESLATIKNHFSSARLASGGFETLPPGDQLRIRAINVLPQITRQELTKMAQEAIENGDWAIFMFHYIDEPDKNELNYSSIEFEKFVTSLLKYKKNVMTMSQVFKLKK